MAQAFLDSPICVSEAARFVGEPKSWVGDHKEKLGNPSAQLISGTQSFRDQSVVECLDTASVLRTYRKPLRGETWLTPLKSERRLLAQVDAIIGLGKQALVQVEALAFDPDVPDPNRLFAAAFTLGCLDDPRWLNSVVAMLLRAAEGTPAEVDAVTEALCLSPNRQIGTALSPLLAHELPAVQAAAIRIMGYRGILPEAAWHTAIASGELAVIAAALKATPRAYRLDACRTALLPLYAHEDERILRLAIRAGLALRSRAAYECAIGVAEIEPARADSLQLAALFGCRAEVTRIRSAMSGENVLVGMKAAGVLGYTDLLPDLFSILEAAEEGSKLSLRAGEAIWMISGLNCRNPAEAAVAQQMWADRGHQYERGVRYRIGRILSTDLLQEQLCSPQWSRKSRQQMYSELMAVTNCGLPLFSVFDFIGTQRIALHAIDQWFAENPQESQALGTML